MTCGGLATKSLLRAALVCAVLLSGCAEKGDLPAQKLSLERVPFSSLKGWEQDSQLATVTAFRKTCSVFQKKDPSFRLRGTESGRIADWLPACAKAEESRFENDAQARLFFETHFDPYAVNQGEEGLFTGYYQAQLRGSEKKTAVYQTPLFKRPADMLSLDLGDFRDSLKGQKITGKIKGTKFVPYDNRELVAQGSLLGRAEPLVWVDDPIGAFFLEVQGSGQILMTDGTKMSVGYDAQNGHGYTPIGRVLAERGEIERPVTMQKIRAWLASHPSEAQNIMNTNPSVVFFRKQEREGAVGAQGAVLTPQRSLAVDPSFVPLGVPVWLQTSNHRQLVIAQDTGGAIKGPVRGDLFWGVGPEAEAGAGEMQETGTYYLLLPKTRGQP